ncbi:MAG: HAMP domain-containing histidine kinase [Clostridia bacterium]|nr:HAMP domain-containing histidine kinase [Clostridia bacterium]
MKRKKRSATVLGLLFFALTVAAVVMIAVLVFDAVRSATDNRWEISLVMLVVIIFIAVVCTVADLIRRRITVDGPVSKILKATEKIASGDFSYRTEPEHTYGKYNSYDIIMENINTLAEELEKSEVLKTDFIANVSHEIKTPLAVIKNYTALLATEGLCDSDRQKYTETVLSATERLGSLITNILKLSKLENSEIHPECERVNIASVLAESALAFEERIEEKGIELECELDDVYSTTSPSYLDIVFSNLLSNAVKFTDRGGRITVSLTESDGRAIVRISDSGCGISQQVGEKMFEKFYQGDTSHRSEGNGLGLALVKRVIDILGAEISVSSTLGVGTTFTVTV